MSGRSATGGRSAFRQPVGRFGRAALLLGAALAIGGCSSARFGGAGLAPAAPTRTARLAPAEPLPVEALPSGSVTSEPLAPLPGSSVAPPPAVLADVPTMPSSPRAVDPTVPAYVPPADVGGAGAGSRSANVGGWTARDATGANCRVSLSSTPSLDLYKASSAGCANKDLAKVTAWDFRDGEVYLYQPGGAVAARLKGSSASLSGVIAKSGAPLTLTR